jgi:pimeloyl-ACP methyl ester carboxylesterase
MALLPRIADRLILQPSTHFVDPEGLERRAIPSPGGEVEAWVSRVESELPEPIPIVILKFPGAGGRAERGRVHPAEFWPNVSAEVWTINQRGYGGTPGPASIQNFAETCEAVWREAASQFPDRQILVYGNSLGCLSALYLTARFPVAGAYLRNPPALAQMIATRARYTWWSFGFSKLIANQIPMSLDAVENGSQSTCPALFMRSERDRVIPPQYQEMVISQYGGPVHQFVIRGADHHHPIPDDQQEEYADAVRWLGNRII